VKIPKWVVAVILIIVIGILLNDLVITPKRNHDYLVSCYWFTFMLANEKADGYTRELFTSCIEENTTYSNAQRCWNIYAPETIGFLKSVGECPRVYDSNLIIFK